MADMSLSCETIACGPRRRSRMEIRRIKFAETHDEQKRQKQKVLAVSFSRGLEDAAENTAPDGVNPIGKVEKSDTTAGSESSQRGNPSTYPKFGFASVRGRRRSMEDAVSVHTSLSRIDNQSKSQLHFFGVYDGHGCSHVATKCKKRLHEILKEELERKESASKDWKSMMQRSFRRMDNEVTDKRGLASNCKCELHSPECNMVGSTAVVTVITPEKIIVANCGDSRALLCRYGKPVPLSSDHKPDRPDELDRIQSAGGRVIYWNGARVLGVLATSRAIGDKYLKPYVSCEPEITITDRTTEDDCLIIASDGLWDVVSNDTTCEVANMCLRREAQVRACSPTKKAIVKSEITDEACTRASVLLTKLALARESSDNVSVLVVDLRRET